MSSFYSAFAERYEQVFPVREPVVRALLGLSAPGDRVLDLGCGPGHHCARLAAADRRTTGVDLDPAMIDTARTAHPEVDARVLDLRDAPGLDGPWRLVWCLGNVASHLPAAALGEMLAGLAVKMPSGAGLLVQTVDWDALADRETYRFPDLALADGVVFHREYRRRDDGAVRFLTRLEEHDRTLFAGEALLHPTDAAAWRALLAGAGFEVESHAADFLGAPFPAPRTPGGSVWTARRR
jgi:SAM-dependent methyltransferase